MESARFDLEAFQPSMLRVLRSARSRLRRETGFEDSGLPVESVVSSTSVGPATARRVSDANARNRRSHRLMQARASLAHAVTSENAVPEKAFAPIELTGVLGDATNTYGIERGMFKSHDAGLDYGANAAEIAGDNMAKWLQADEHAKAVQAEQLKSARRTAVTEHMKASAEQQAKLKSSEHLVTQSVPTLARSADADVLSAYRGNPLYAEEYAQDIFHTMQRDEPMHLPSPSYMDHQVHVNAKMRAILVDWLVDVHKKYKLRSETLFLAVQIIDRYLAVQVAAQRHLQLVGVTALMIAAKFEEIHPPPIKEFVYVTDKAYSQEEIVKMEVCILKALKFKVCCPTAMLFLERYQTLAGCSDSHRDLALYLLELSLVEYKMLRFAPSHLAAAAILLSNKLLRRPSWPSVMPKHTQMTEAMLKECAKEMCRILEGAEHNSLQAVRRKFSQLKYNSVAKLNFMVVPDSQATASLSSARRSTGGLI